MRLASIFAVKFFISLLFVTKGFTGQLWVKCEIHAVSVIRSQRVVLMVLDTLSETFLEFCRVRSFTFAG